MKKLIPVICITLLFMITQTGCSTEEPVSDSGFYLNTTCDITIYNMEDMSKKNAQTAIDDSFALIDKYEKQMMSRTAKGSDVYTINHSQGKAVKVNDETLEVINLGLEMNKITDGRFDITLGKISDMWNFTGDNPKVPADADIQAALTETGCDAIQIDGNNVTLNSGAWIDLGAVAKGYIADRVGDFLEEEGVTSAIINLGGNVVAIGAKDGDKDWRIGIERPYSDRTEVIGAVEVKDSTVVTSGIYERKFEEKGKLYHHVLDPATGYPAETDLEAVTVVADKGNSCLCDGLATSCLLLGLDEAQNLIAEMQTKYPDKHIRASFMGTDDKVYKSEGMEIMDVD
ncbi:MAG: FAD:protein FMN transferase [Firmicutes bacterium]|nr:FAD:protein FMN transferase [Bacillota bacterium]